MDVTPIIDGLNDAQREAVTAPAESCLVLAGAGSGKTRVLILAESDGRRESLLDFVRSSGLTPPMVENLQAFLASDEKVGMATSVCFSDPGTSNQPRECVICHRFALRVSV